MNLLLHPGLLEQVTEHAKQAFPNEGCGFLVGRGAAERFIAMKNVSTSAFEFEMDPTELFQTFREIRDSGEQLVAIYHSHPHGPAEPSATDIARAYYPDAAHLIISLADPENPRYGAFRIIDREPLRIEVHVIV